MRISKTKTVLVAAAAAGLMAWQPAQAGFSQGDNVTMGNQSILKNMAHAGGMSGEHRAWLAQDALDNALVLASDTTPSAVTVSRENGAVVLLLDGQRFATVDAASASQANMSVDQLAQSWATSVKEFLSDREHTLSYIQTLKNEHDVQASIAILERRMFAPAGLKFPITLTTFIDSSTASAGDVVEATIDRDVPMGHYVIPAGSRVIGEIVEQDHDNFYLRFTSLRTADGTLLPIDAIVVNSFIAQSTTAHLVCTYAIPSGSANNEPTIIGRIPASVGIGTEEESSSRTLVFHRATGRITAERPMFLEFENVTQVSVVMRNMPM